jgi:hypothetical protein
VTRGNPEHGTLTPRNSTSSTIPGTASMIPQYVSHRPRGIPPRSANSHSGSVSSSSPSPVVPMREAFPALPLAVACETDVPFVSNFVVCR